MHKNVKRGKLQIVDRFVLNNDLYIVHGQLKYNTKFHKILYSTFGEEVYTNLYKLDLSVSAGLQNTP
ncbi:MAG: hypothetical protein ABW185_22660, partial [Sedimenticola sp.]